MANGGIIGKENASSAALASGIWQVTEHFIRKVAGKWDAALFQCDYTMCAGGGGFGDAQGYDDGAGGGGAGGYINSYGSQTSGGGVAAQLALQLETLVNYTVTIGASATTTHTNGSDTSISGSGINTITAIGGGGGGQGYSNNNNWNADDGGSGGGGGAKFDGSNSNTGTAGSGTANQGFDGNTGRPDFTTPNYCSRAAFANNPECQRPADGTTGGGGGGATGPTTSSQTKNGGDGAQSGITGTNIYRCGGGNGEGLSGGGLGYDQAGGGGSDQYRLGKDGILILRYSNLFTMTNPGGGLTFITSTVGSDSVSQIQSGTGTIQFDLT